MKGLGLACALAFVLPTTGTAQRTAQGTEASRDAVTPCALGERVIDGRVMDLLSLYGLDGAEVVVSLDGRIRDRELSRTTTGLEGRFRVCVPDQQVAVQLRALFDDTEGRTTLVQPDFDDVVALYVQISQPVTITGTVTDGRAGGPLSGAMVALQGGRMSTRSDADGRFTLRGASPGQRILRVSHDGFIDRVDSLYVVSGQPLNIGVVMGTDVFEIEAVEVVAGAQRDQQSGLLLTAFEGIRGAAVDSVSRRTPTMLSLISSARIGSIRVREEGPGVSEICIEDSRAGSNLVVQCEMIEIYINGVLTRNARQMIADMDPRIVSRVEYLRKARGGAVYNIRGHGALFIDYKVGRR